MTVGEGVVTLPCCAILEMPEEKAGTRCPGTMTLRWPRADVFVCDTCRGQCGSLAHPRCDVSPTPPYFPDAVSPSSLEEDRGTGSL